MTKRPKEPTRKQMNKWRQAALDGALAALPTKLKVFGAGENADSTSTDEAIAEAVRIGISFAEEAERAGIIPE